MPVSETAQQVKAVTRDELKSKIDRKEPLAIVEALAPEQFRQGHLPGAVNVPPDRVRALAPTLLPDRQKEVVVYCSGVICKASATVARELAALGYTNVGHYAGGKADWTGAGLPVERGV